MATATMTSKGQITIPKVVRERLGLDTGDQIEFVETGDGVFTIVAATRDVRELKGIIPRPAKAVSIEDMKRAAARMGGRR